MNGIVGILLTILIYGGIVGLLMWGISQIPGIPRFVIVILWVLIGVIFLLWIASLLTGGSILGGEHLRL